MYPTLGYMGYKFGKWGTKWGTKWGIKRVINLAERSCYLALTQSRRGTFEINIDDVIPKGMEMRWV